jgi:hypothetical protein
MYQPSRPAYVPGMEHFQPPPRRSWVRRHSTALWVSGALAVIALVTLLGYASSGTAAHPDYRDPVQLARAMKDAEHSYSASCAKLPTGKYFCTVANTDGTSGNYTVTVAADGKSYSAS